MSSKKKSGLSRIKKFFDRPAEGPPTSSNLLASASIVSITPSKSSLEPLSSTPTTPVTTSQNTRPSDSTSNSLTTATPNVPLLAQTPKHVGWIGLKTFASLLSKFATTFGPLKQAVNEIVMFVEAFENVLEGREDYEKLSIELNVLFCDLSGYFGQSIPPVMTPSILSLAQGIQHEIELVLRKQQQSDIGRFTRAREDVDEVLECYRRIQRLLERLTLNANINIWKTVDEQATETRLRNLPNSPAAKYNSVESLSLRRNGCAPNTRVHVLEQLRDWTSDNTSQKIYWLNGMAGTGKTTIAYTLCEQLENTRILAASFFCSRQLPACRNVSRIVPTISYQLSRYSQPFRHAISRVLDEDPDAHNQPVPKQFKQLVTEPLIQVKDTLPTNLVIAIDALDECDDDEGVRIILNVLLSHACDLPGIRFLVTSRPDAKILDQMRGQEEGHLPAELRLHELERSTVQEDIRTFLLAKFNSRMDLSPADLNTLVERSGVLFIYAATVARYIGSDNFSRGAKRLREVLNVSSGSSNNSDKEIDAVYTAILEAAFKDPTLTNSDRAEMQLVLHAVICAQEPLSVDTIGGLLKLDVEASVYPALRPLFSVLQVSDTTRTVTTLHESFPNYLRNKTRCNTFHCDVEEHNALLAHLCFDQIAHPSPPFNICGLSSSYVFDKDVPDLDAKVDSAISPKLYYACRYWAAHLMSAQNSYDLAARLLSFLSERFILWIEIMNLKGSIHNGTVIMYQIQQWSQVGLEEKDIEMSLMER
ncbi:hypothetical protein FRC07_007723 [Ceratobasidium sp. 392]|nr:hypothetical protein FRC07_007723 [Ceratobasidium sp. 392]